MPCLGWSWKGSLAATDTVSPDNTPPTRPSSQSACVQSNAGTPRRGPIKRFIADPAQSSPAICDRPRRFGRFSCGPASAINAFQLLPRWPRHLLLSADSSFALGLPDKRDARRVLRNTYVVVPMTSLLGFTRRSHLKCAKKVHDCYLDHRSINA